MVLESSGYGTLISDRSVARSDGNSACVKRGGALCVCVCVRVCMCGRVTVMVLESNGYGVISTDFPEPHMPYRNQTCLQ